MLSSIFVLDAQHIQAFSDTLEAADAMSMQKSMQNQAPLLNAGTFMTCVETWAASQSS